MKHQLKRSTFVLIIPAFILIGSLGFTMGGCKLSCESDDRSDAAKVIDDIGDGVKDAVKEIKDHD